MLIFDYSAASHHTSPSYDDTTRGYSKILQFLGFLNCNRYRRVRSQKAVINVHWIYNWYTLRHIVALVQSRTKWPSSQFLQHFFKDNAVIIPAASPLPR